MLWEVAKGLQHRWTLYATRFVSCESNFFGYTEIAFSLINFESKVEILGADHSLCLWRDWSFNGEFANRGFSGIIKRINASNLLNSYED